MERNTDNSARVAGGPTSTGVLTRGQMARALREGALGEVRSGGTGGGVTTGAISRVNVRKYINNKDLRTSCGGVTLAMLMAATITVAPTAGIPRNSANVPSSGPQPAGSIPRTPSPSVGDGNSVHPYVSDVNQGHQKKMLNKITSVTAAAVVGIAATVAGAQSGAVQWRVEDRGNGHWYEIQQLPTRPTCVEAESMAIQSGARPIALETLAENDFFRLLRCSQVNQHLSGWQDLRRVSNQWTWGSGEPFVFQSWSAGQPDSGDTATIDWAGPNGQCETLTWGDENCTVANLPAALFLEWYAEGGLWIENNVITGYDGVFALPTVVIDKLKEWGYDVSEIE